MAKEVIKEIVIFLLLLISVALLLGVLFYDYIPNTKTIPSKVVPYKLPETISEELQSTEAEGKNIIKTYSIDSTDLKLYESTDEYDKGKANPFEKYSAPEPTASETNIGANTNTSTDTNSTTNTSGNTTNTSSVGNFFETEGK